MRFTKSTALIKLRETNRLRNQTKNRRVVLMIVSITKEVSIKLIIIKIFKEVKIIKIAIIIIINCTIITIIRAKYLIFSKIGKIRKTTCRTTTIVRKGHQGKDRELLINLKGIGTRIKNKQMIREKFKPTQLKLKMYKESKPNIGKIQNINRTKKIKSLLVILLKQRY